MKIMPVYKVWNGRYSKIVVARGYFEAAKKSGYADVDQIDRIAKRIKDYKGKIDRR